MDFKTILFFIVTFFLLSYLLIIWENRHIKTELTCFGKKLPIGQGLLLLGVLIDGMIFGAAYFWLLAG
jgi:hypothetical protein